ncbi:hypothetical protein V5O48_008064 [Marasmius crinis-equi]|uniref:Uncharacterized protein n=1 Tax=Marasmius crinis-equi TaxID=585013 RepID=A0ABR3FF24_9AGAR
MSFTKLFSTLYAALALTSSVNASTTSTVSNWGDNPSHLPAMLVFRPNTLVSNPPIFVGLHPCGGTDQQWMSSTDMPSFDDRLGFPILFPTSNSQGGFNCWDAHSNAYNTHI